MGNNNNVVVIIKKTLWFSGMCGQVHYHDEGAVRRMFKFSVKISYQIP
jgi:hypothetical protein